MNSVASLYGASDWQSWKQRQPKFSRAEDNLVGGGKVVLIIWGYWDEDANHLTIIAGSATCEQRNAPGARLHGHDSIILEGVERLRIRHGGDVSEWPRMGQAESRLCSDGWLWSDGVCPVKVSPNCLVLI